MSPQNWQDLFASNQAIIERAQAQGLAGLLDRPESSAVVRMPEPPRPSGLVALPTGPLPSAPPSQGLRLPAGLSGLPGMPDAPALPLGDGPWEPLPGGGERGAFLYSPPELPAGPAPLVVMLHGCTQTPASFAAAALVNREADRHGFLVLYPEQTSQDNPQCCWNWFQAGHQVRGGGEPAALADAVRRTAVEVSVEADRVFVAGLSAGGAMAAVLAATYPDVFAGVAVHSGLPYAAATDMGGAFGAMAQGAPGGDVRRAMGRRARAVPMLVVHGSADHTVAPANGDRLLAQWHAANGAEAPLDQPSTTAHGAMPGGYEYTRDGWHDRDGRLVLSSLRIEGLGHAWSGGAPGGSHTDPRGPSASAAIWRFFSEATARP